MVMGPCKIFFARFFILISIVSAKMGDIMSEPTIESWISLEDFEIMIEASMHEARCSNIFVSGESEGTVKLFNKFVKMYPFSYTVNMQTYECTGYFMISTTVQELVAATHSVPTTISTTEMLIIVDDDVEDSSALFDVQMYANAKVNIAAHNGLWTLSESYLHPRLFRNVSRPKEMEHEHGIINLQSQELQVAAFLNAPFCFLETTVNRTVNGKEEEFFILENGAAEEELEFDGVEVKLFLMIAKRLNFTYSIRKPKDNKQYGRRNGSDWDGGLIGQMFHKEVDIAFSGIVLTPENYEFTNLTNPWGMVHMHFLVPRPKPYASFWALTKPFSPNVWYGLIAMLVVQSIYVYTSAWVDPMVPKRLRSFTIAWTEMMGRLLGTCAPKNIQGLKLLVQLWHIVGVLMVTAYSSSLAESLTNPSYDKRIDTVKQFIEANLTWGREGPEPLFPIYADENDPYAKQLPKRFKHETGQADRYRKILNGNYALVGKIVDNAYFPEQHTSPEYLKGYRVMKQSTGDHYLTFAVQPRLLESFNMVMLWLQEAGLIQHCLDDVIYRRTGKELHELFIEYDTMKKRASPLEVTPLEAGYLLYFLGLLISTVVFYLELRSVRGTGSIRDVLIDVKNKREIRLARELEAKRRFSAFKKFSRERFALRNSRINEWIV